MKLNLDILVFALFLSVVTLLESTVTTLPLVLIFLGVYYIVTKNQAVFLLGFLRGVLLDISRLQTIGQSSIIFICFIFVLFLYQRKFETASLQFVVVSSFFGSLVFLLLSDYHTDAILQAGVCTVIAVISYIVLTHIYPEQKNGFGEYSHPLASLK